MRNSILRPYFAELVSCAWSYKLDAFRVRVKNSTILLSPNSDTSLTHGVHIDAITVSPQLRRKGDGTRSMETLCRRADRHQITLEGGPIYTGSRSDRQAPAWRAHGSEPQCW